MKVSKKQFIEQFNGLKLVHSTRLIANSLASFAGCKELFPSQDAIMERAGVGDKRSFRKAIAFLTDHGFIKIENKKYVLLLRESTEEIEPQRKKNGTYTKKVGDKYIKTTGNIAPNDSTITQNKREILHEKMHDNTFAVPQLYIKNYKFNYNNNYKNNCKSARASSHAPLTPFLGVHESCQNDCENEKIEIQNLMAENEKLKNALEALESKNKTLDDEILNLNKKIEISASQVGKNAIEMQELKAENERLKEKRLKKSELEEKKKNKELVLQGKIDNFKNEIDNFVFSQQSLGYARKRGWDAKQIDAAQDAFKAKMYDRLAGGKPYDCINAAATKYITSTWLDAAADAVYKKTYNNSTNEQGSMTGKFRNVGKKDPSKTYHLTENPPTRDDLEKFFDDLDREDENKKLGGAMALSDEDREFEKAYFSKNAALQDLSRIGR